MWIQTLPEFEELNVRSGGTQEGTWPRGSLYPAVFKYPSAEELNFISSNFLCIIQNISYYTLKWIPEEFPFFVLLIDIRKVSDKFCFQLRIKVTVREQNPSLQNWPCFHPQFNISRGSVLLWRHKWCHSSWYLCSFLVVWGWWHSMLQRWPSGKLGTAEIFQTKINSEDLISDANLEMLLLFL